MTEQEHNFRYLKETEMQLNQICISGGVTFAGSLFGVIQGIQLFDTTKGTSLQNIFLIVGITLFVLVLATFFSHYTRFMEEDLHQEIEKLVVKGQIKIDSDGYGSRKLSESLIFLFLMAEGLIIFSKISFLLYTSPYLILLWVILYLLISQQICFNTTKLLQFYPKE